uniref:Ell-associated factor Eaf n=1 Tax=Glossina pallidipes TaxID=7398 RepID=A0A1B0AGD5_GLOPL
MMMMKQKISLAERLNIGDEVRELKLGCTFNSKNTTNAFHTIKLSSGVPHTIYKGNQKKYTKECILIYDKETGDITLEKLNHNIQVKKTRSEMTNKANVVPILSGAGGGGGGPPPPVGAGAGSVSAGKLENSTMRITSKTKVSTGSRRNTISKICLQLITILRFPELFL